MKVFLGRLGVIFLGKNRRKCFNFFREGSYYIEGFRGYRFYGYGRMLVGSRYCSLGMEWFFVVSFVLGYE